MNTTIREDGSTLKYENHWGIYVFDDTPVTGVVSQNSLEWLHDEVDYRAVTNLSYDAYLEQNIGEMTTEWQSGQDDPNALPDEDQLEQWRDQLAEQYEASGDRYLIGAWVWNEDAKLWDVDKSATGENAYAAIVDYDWGGGIVQVVWSKFVTRGALCSPCLPGQVDLDTPGNYLGYDLPLSFYGEYRQNSNAQIEWPA